MSESLDHIFPPDQCLTEEAMLLTEQIFDQTIISYFAGLGPYSADKVEAHMHLEEPFAASAEDCRRKDIYYEAVFGFADEYMQLRRKLGK
jgi:hypothetical protein